ASACSGTRREEIPARAKHRADNLGGSSCSNRKSRTRRSRNSRADSKHSTEFAGWNVTSAYAWGNGQHLPIVLDADPYTSASCKLQPNKPAGKPDHQKQD